jgi:hypothetical protein
MLNNREIDPDLNAWKPRQSIIAEYSSTLYSICFIAAFTLAVYYLSSVFAHWVIS